MANANGHDPVLVDILEELRRMRSETTAGLSAVRVEIHDLRLEMTGRLDGTIVRLDRELADLKERVAKLES